MINFKIKMNKEDEARFEGVLNSLDKENFIYGSPEIKDVEMTADKNYPVFINHEDNELPVGSFKAFREDGKLMLSAVLAKTSEKFENLKELIKMGALSLSVGGSLYEDGTLFLEEASLVGIPADIGAGITSVSMSKEDRSSLDKVLEVVSSLQEKIDKLEESLKSKELEQGKEEEKEEEPTQKEEKDEELIEEVAEEDKTTDIKEENKEEVEEVSEESEEVEEPEEISEEDLEILEILERSEV
jgi:hypothetical protein